MMTAVYVLLGLCVFCVVAVKIFFVVRGTEKFVLHKERRTPFEKLEQTDTSIKVVTTMELANEGNQCGLIMDIIARPQLPFEQYDGMDVRGKVDRVDAPREDDYFEAMLIYRRESVMLRVVLTLTARKGMSLKEALAHMVDFPIDIIYMESGRTPCHYTKTHIELTAEELAKLAGVQLAKD